MNQSTKPYRPWELIYYEASLNQEDAKRREMYLKTNQGGRLLKRRLKDYFFTCVLPEVLLPGMIKKTYKVSGLHCSSCPLVIEGELEDIGVKATCNFAKETLEVEYNQDTVSEEKIQDTVISSGYKISALI